MIILVVNQHPLDIIGGSEIQCDIISNKLTQFGHKVIYYALNASNTTYISEYQVVPGKRFNLQKFYHIVKENNPDVIYWRFGKESLLIATIVTKLLKKNFVFATSHITDVKIWVYAAEQIVFNTSAHLTGEPIEYVFRKIIGDLLRLKPIKSVLNFLAFPLFVDGTILLREDLKGYIPVKKSICIYDSLVTDTKPFYWEKPFVVWVASIKKSKNPEKYYQLAKELMDINIDFLMVGKIQDKRYEYFNVFHELPNFHYLGLKSPIEVNGILNRSLFLVHTCDPEGFGNNFMQAWFQGKPTISLYFDPESIIEREKIGFFSRTYDRFVEQTRLLIGNNDLRLGMGENAKKYALRHFNPVDNTRKLESFLTSLLRVPDN